MTKETKAPESETHLKEDVIKMAEKFEKALKLDTKTGIATSEDNLYESLLPEDLSMDTVNAVGKHNSNFIAAGTYAFGSMAVNAMSKHKGLTKASATVKMGGRDLLNLTVDHSKSYVNHLTGNGEETVKYGVVTAGYEVRAGRNSGELKKARALIGEMALAKLSK